MINPLQNKNFDIDLATYDNYYTRLKLIALTLFEWENLPSSCNARYLEHTLFEHGKSIFFFDENLGFLNMKCTSSGELNIYNEPLKYIANSHAYSRTFNSDDVVIIRNNLLETPTKETIQLFASRLAQLERTIDININAQKTPIMVNVDEKDRLTMINLYNKYKGNTPFIVGSKSLNPDSLRVLKTDAPYLVDKLHLQKQNIWNEVLTFLGIKNANTDKRERLITEEVNSINNLIEINAQTMLNTRKHACKIINEKFNLNLDVKLRVGEESWQNTLPNLEK